MNLPKVAALVVCLASGPALAGIQLIEMKNGKLYEATDSVVVGDKLRISLHTGSSDQTMVFSVPIDKVLPERVYYVWAGQIADADVAGRVKLAEWCRTQGLFRQAWRQYAAAAEADEKFMKKIPELEAAMSEEAATWHFEQAEEAMRAGDLHRARLMAESVLKDYPGSKEVARTKGLLSLLAEREQFQSVQKREAEIAARAKVQRREFDKQLKAVDTAKLHIRNTRMKYVMDARQRLRRAAYALRRAADNMRSMLPFVEVDDLRLSIEAVVVDTEKNMVGAFTRLADLRFLSGDTAAALDAAHEVLWVDPDNKAMADIRKRILNGEGFRRYGYRHRYYDGRVCRRFGYLPPFATPYYIRRGSGIFPGVSWPYQGRLRASRVTIGSTFSGIRYVR